MSCGGATEAAGSATSLEPVTERGVERMIERLIVILGVREQQGYNRRMALARAFEALAKGETTDELDTPN